MPRGRADDGPSPPAWLAGGALVVPRTKGDGLYEVIREAIVSGKVEPGAQLNARELATHIGVSVMPIREALHRLAAEGLVNIRPHVGAFVTELPIGRLIEYLDVRLVLECYALELAVRFIDGAQLGALYEFIDMMDIDLAKSDWPSYGRHNHSFHRTIYSFCRNSALVEEIDRLFAFSERGRALFALEPAYAERSQAEHRELMSALEDRDGARAANLMTRHRQRNLDALHRRAAHSDAPTGRPKAGSKQEGDA